jgi:hypothetical protein
MNKLKRAIQIVVGLVVLIQVIPIPRTNPPVTADLQALPAVRDILRRSCYDCHSHETRWPWYTYVAPVSWLIVHDVHEARGHLDFSKWQAYSPDDQWALKNNIFLQVSTKQMPLPRYLRLHPQANVTPAELETLKQWITSADP